MRARLLCCAVLLMLVAGCLGPVPSLTPTPTVQVPTSTRPAEPTSTPALATIAPEPTSTPPPQTAAPAPTSTPLSTATPLPPEWIALYGAGPELAPQLYALASDGSIHGLEVSVHWGATVSTSGRWIASPSSYPSAASVIITDLQGETSYTIDVTEGWGIYDMALDRAEQRLAILELAPAPVPAVPWAIIVVDLADGSAARFVSTTRPEVGVYPGNPLTWASAGWELLLGTFLPYSDGLYAGVQALTIPPGTAPASIDALPQRTLIPGGAYRSVPHLSPDGTRLLYLARDPEYMPADYDPALDFAVNQLWSLDIEGATPTLLAEVADGDALGGDAAWAPDSDQVLFARGHYAGMNWGSLSLQLRDGAGNVQELVPLPVAEEGADLRLAWCRQDVALAVLTTGPGRSQLYMVDVQTGNLERVASAETLFVLDCVETP